MKYKGISTKESFVLLLDVPHRDGNHKERNAEGYACLVDDALSAASLDVGCTCTTEGCGEAGCAMLQQDGKREEHPDDDFCSEEDGLHAFSVLQYMVGARGFEPLTLSV